MAPKQKKAQRRASSGCSDDEDYRKKRDRNNQAVKRSRNKAKAKSSQTKDRVDLLKVDNEKMQERIKQKQDQLKVLKELFLDTAKAKQDAGAGNIDLRTLLADDDDDGPSGSNAT